MRRTLALCCLFCFLLIQITAVSRTDAQDVKEWADAYATPTITGAGVDAADQKLSFGHLQIELTAGRLFPVMVNGRIAGVYVTGKGRFRYRSVDPFETANSIHRIKEYSPYERAADGSFGDEIDDALVMVSSGAAGLIAATATEGEVPAEATAAFSRHVERWRQDHVWRYLEMMPQAQLDPPAEPVVLVEIGAKKEDLIYTYDPMRDHDESIAVMKEVGGPVNFLKDRRYAQYLSVQPIGRTRLEPRAIPWVLTAVDVTLVNSSELAAAVSVSEVIEARSPVAVLAFNVADKVVGTTGLTASLAELDYTLDKVTDSEGKSVPFVHVSDVVLVQLPKPLAKGEKVELRFELSGDILFRPGNDSYWELHSGASWYPAPQRWAQESFQYHAIVKSAAPFIPFSTGATVRRWQEEKLNCAEFKSDGPIQAPAILAGKYHTYTDEREHLTVRVSSYAMKNERAAKTLAGMVHGFVEFYKPFLGDYPFSQLDVIEVNELGFGQAPAGIIFITSEAFTPNRDMLSKFYSRGINARVAHEVAHAWWGHVAMLSDHEDQWLSESTADYYAAIAMKSLGRERDYKRAVLDWQNGAKAVGDRGSVFLGNYVGGEHRYHLLYEKGPLVLKALHDELGDQVFFTVFKSFLKSFKNEPAWTKELVGITNFITKKDYRPWFDRYLFGTEIPKVE